MPFSNYVWAINLRTDELKILPENLKALMTSAVNFLTRITIITFNFYYSHFVFGIGFTVSISGEIERIFLLALILSSRTNKCSWLHASALFLRLLTSKLSDPNSAKKGFSGSIGRIDPSVCQSVCQSVCLHKHLSKISNLKLERKITTLYCIVHFCVQVDA